MKILKHFFEDNPNIALKIIFFDIVVRVDSRGKKKPQTQDHGICFANLKLKFSWC